MHKDIQNFESGSKKMFLGFTAGIWAAAVVSAVTTFDGLMDAGNGQGKSILIALVGALVIGLFFTGLNYFFPWASIRWKAFFAALLVPFTIGVMFFSSIFSALSVGGKDAIDIHRQTVIAETTTAGITLLRRAQTITGFGPQLCTLANQARGSASDELAGRQTGIVGAGVVYQTFVNKANLLQNLCDYANNTGEVKRDLYGQLNVEISKMRDLASSSDLDEVEKNNQIASQLSRVNEMLTEMAYDNSATFLVAMTDELAGLTKITSANIAPSQREVLARSDEMDASIQRMMADLIGREELGDIEVPTFTMISAQGAIYRYWREIPYAWAFALMFDLVIPMLFVALLSGGTHTRHAYRMRRKAEEEEERGSPTSMRMETAIAQ